MPASVRFYRMKFDRAMGITVHDEKIDFEVDDRHATFPNPTPETEAYLQQFVKRHGGEGLGRSRYFEDALALQLP